MAISGSVSSVSQIKGSISQGNELVVTRITVPGPQGPQGASGSSENKVLDKMSLVLQMVLFSFVQVTKSSLREIN